MIVGLLFFIVAVAAGNPAALPFKIVEDVFAFKPTMHPLVFFFWMCVIMGSVMMILLILRRCIDQKDWDAITKSHKQLQRAKEIYAREIESEKQKRLQEIMDKMD